MRIEYAARHTRGSKVYILNPPAPNPFIAGINAAISNGRLPIAPAAAVTKNRVFDLRFLMTARTARIMIKPKKGAAKIVKNPKKPTRNDPVKERAPAITAAKT